MDARLREKLRPDPAREAEEARDRGFFTRYELRQIPLKQIIPQDVWNADKYDRAKAAIASRTPLPPIEVHAKGNRFGISDGIHRFNASRDLGLTHIPAIINYAIDAPEKLQVVAARPQYRPKQLVYLRNPPPGVHQWAMIGEHLTQQTRHGVMRHRYALVGLKKQSGAEADLIGDFWDDEFDVVRGRPPPAILKALKSSWWWEAT